MLKRLAIFLTLSIAALGLAAAIPAGAITPNPNQSLNCNQDVNPGRIHCSATDNDGIARIRLTDKQTGALEKVTRFSCVTPLTKATGFSYADNGDPHRVQVLDCKGGAAAYNVPALTPTTTAVPTTTSLPTTTTLATTTTTSPPT
jgi:hypothetical protein